MQPYIIEMLLEDPKDKAPYHGSFCAIADDRDAAILLARTLAMDWHWIVTSVESASLKNELPLDDNTALDDTLHRKALQRTPPCAAVFVALKPESSATENRNLGTPEQNRSRH